MNQGTEVAQQRRSRVFQPKAGMGKKKRHQKNNKFKQISA
jgi:hypothetical protein